MTLIHTILLNFAQKKSIDTKKKQSIFKKKKKKWNSKAKYHICEEYNEASWYFRGDRRLSKVWIGVT